MTWHASVNGLPVDIDDANVTNMDGDSRLVFSNISHRWNGTLFECFDGNSLISHFFIIVEGNFILALHFV